MSFLLMGYKLALYYGRDYTRRDISSGYGIFNCTGCVFVNIYDSFRPIMMEYKCISCKKDIEYVWFCEECLEERDI